MPTLIRLAISIALLALVASQFGDGLLEQLQTADTRWLLAALALGFAQITLSAWRWRFTAGHLAIPLTRRVALGEYYLATLVNQTLPGGVLGDAQRAWRHGRQLPRHGPAFQAVVIERLSGQIAMGLLALAAWTSSPWASSGDRSQSLLLLLALIGFVAIISTGLSRAHTAPDWMRDWRDALSRGLFNRRVLPLQLMASFTVAAGYVGGFVCCLMALGPAGGIMLWIALIPPVLFAMLIPLSIAGWGIRESAAALLWPMAGLPAAEGVAAAILYGAISLLAGVPGVMVLLRR